MILEFDMTYSDLKKNPDKARKGMNILDTSSPNLTRFIVVDVINGHPILIHNGDKHSLTVPANMIGDYMLNLRTGYISFISKDYKITDPIHNKRLNDIALSALREEYLP